MEKTIVSSSLAVYRVTLCVGEISRNKGSCWLTDQQNLPCGFSLIGMQAEIIEQIQKGDTVAIVFVESSQPNDFVPDGSDKIIRIMVVRDGEQKIIFTHELFSDLIAMKFIDEIPTV